MKKTLVIAYLFKVLLSNSIALAGLAAIIASSPLNGDVEAHDATNRYFW